MLGCFPYYTSSLWAQGMVGVGMQTTLFGTKFVPEHSKKSSKQAKFAPEEPFAGGYVLYKGVLQYKHADGSIVPLVPRDVDLSIPSERKRAVCYCGVIHMG